MESVALILRGFEGQVGVAEKSSNLLQTQEVAV
jgi:hypothetical protein